jgi:uncharacterized repeat protein (TIGR01451 family)
MCRQTQQRIMRSAGPRPGPAVLAGVAVLALLAPRPAPPAQAQPAPTTVTFAYTGAAQTWTVPARVTSVTFDVYGAQGGDVVNYTAGGRGGRAMATLPVTPGSVVTIMVGGAGDSVANCSGQVAAAANANAFNPLFPQVQPSGGAPGVATGSASGGAVAIPALPIMPSSPSAPSRTTPGADGFNGGGGGGSGQADLCGAAGGGGGASDVRIGGVALTDRVLVAGGGGGAADSISVCLPEGGAGGGLTGGAGGCNGGGGGDQTGMNGSGQFGQGSAGSEGASSGGGSGGGGYYGGAGGQGAGGGGGSGFGPPDTIFETGVREGHGLVTIAYTAPTPDLDLTLTTSSDPIQAGTALTYTLTVTNIGFSAAEMVELTASLPATTTFVSLSAPDGWNCTPIGVGRGGPGPAGFPCTRPTLAAGAAPQTVTVVVQVPGTLAGTAITATATVTAAHDVDPTNNSATTMTPVCVPIRPQTSCP